MRDSECSGAWGSGPLAGGIPSMPQIAVVLHSRAMSQAKPPGFLFRTDHWCKYATNFVVEEEEDSNNGARNHRKKNSGNGKLPKLYKEDAVFWRGKLKACLDGKSLLV
jgi:hypothetical protein